jgi:hypothetical protein
MCESIERMLRRASGLVAAVLLIVFLPAAARAQQAHPGANCSNTSVGFTPLTDLRKGTYKGYQGGLYPNGSNKPPAAYQKIGMTHAKAIKPLDSAGKPDPNGSIVLLSIGMSNATMEWQGFMRLAAAYAQKNSRAAVVDGAFGGQDAEIIKNPNARYWQGVKQRLSRAGATDQQVQAIWLKEAIARENEPFPQDATHLRDDLKAIVLILQQRFPNLQVVYLASRIYAGYASTPLNPEPYAYQSGFAVKWLIEQQIKQTTRHTKSSTSTPAIRPWLAWGPYLWTDGMKGRSDGLVWTCADVRQNDGTHPSAGGIEKVAGLLLKFFSTDQTTRSWFNR